MTGTPMPRKIACWFHGSPTLYPEMVPASSVAGICGGGVTEIRTSAWIWPETSVGE
jgi:hypothetical protein